MDVIEKAIRSAFDKGTPDDRAFRERVYRQAFAALDRALQANPNATVENAIARRRQLQAQIVEIESEFIPAVRTAAQPEETGRVDPGFPTAPPEGVASGAERPEPAPPPIGAPHVTPPRIDVPDFEAFGQPAPPVSSPRIATAEAPPVDPAFSADPVFDTPVDAIPNVDVAAERAMPRSSKFKARGKAPDVRPGIGGYDPRLRQRRGSFRGAIVIFLLFAVLASAGWWAVRQGLLQLPVGQNTGEVRAPQDGEAEEFAPDEGPPPLRPAETASERTWVTVFEPADPTRVSAPADASAEVMQDESGPFLRIRSGKSGSAVAFDVGQGVLEQLSGKKAVFDIIARAEGGGQSEMSVDCNFAELGDCGRKRYAVGYERGEYLFEVEFPAADPGAGGTIAVNSDFAGQGRAIDIYEIRVAAE